MSPMFHVIKILLTIQHGCRVHGSHDVWMNYSYCKATAHRLQSGYSTHVIIRLPLLLVAVAQLRNQRLCAHTRHRTKQLRKTSL